MNKLIDFMIVGTTVSLSVNNFANDIMSSGADPITKVKQLGARMLSRFTGIAVNGETGLVINLGGAVSNGQFLAGILAQASGKIAGGISKAVGVKLIDTSKIQKWGRLNTKFGFWSGLISENPPALSTLIANQLGTSSNLLTTSHNSSQVALN